MGLLRLFVDTTAKRLVRGVANSQQVTLPELYYGDIHDMEVYLLRDNPSGGPSTPYEQIDVSSYDLRAGIGALATSTPEALQTVWTKTTSDPHFVGQLDLGTTNMGTSIGSSANITRYFAIQACCATGAFETVYQQQIVVWNQVLSSASAAPTPTSSYWTTDNIKSLGILTDNSDGKTITLRSSNGTYGVIIGVNDDGSLRTETFTV